MAGTGAAAVGGDKNVVDIVEAGADPTGEEPIDDVLAEYNRDDTRIEFPDGRYKLNELSLYKRSNFAMVGTGDATLVPGENYNRDIWIGGGFVEDLRFEGFTIDNSAPDTYPQVAFGGYGTIVVRDVYKHGFHDGHSVAFGVSAWDKESSALVENLEMPDGSEPETAVAVYVETKGPVTFRDCHIEGFGNNGLYASCSDGPVKVEGGTYKNNDITQVRLGSPGSYVRNATIAVDDPMPEHDNSRGVRVSDGHGPVTIDNCDIAMERGKGGGGVVSAYSGGSFHLKNSRIYVGEEYSTVGSSGTTCGNAVLATEPTGIEDTGTSVIENTSITGTGDDFASICLRRDDHVIRNVCINESGDHRDGVVAERGATNNTVEDSNINVPGDVVQESDGTIDATGITVSDACPFPANVDKSMPGNGTPPLADAPWPDDSSRRTFATMGQAGAPTADVFFGFTTPQDDQAALMALPRLLGEFVQSGDLNVRYHPYGLENDRGRYLAGMLQGVWTYEWPKFWEVFGWVYENHEDYTLEGYQDGREFMQAAGVRNYGYVPALASGDEFASIREQSADIAGDHGIPGSIPCIALNGEMTWFDRNDPHERDDLVDWVQTNL